jgi:hypothetical protein
MEQRASMHSVEEIGAPRPSILGHAGSRWTLRILCLLVLLYIPVEWIVGRSPGSTSIFSSQHRDLKRQFLAMDSALRQQLISECKEHGVHDIFFADSDVISPYLVNEVEATQGCTLYRETDVTPIESARKRTCSAEVVDESLPDAWNPVHHWQDLGPLEDKLMSVSTWESDSKQFGFQLLRTRGCVDVTEPVVR